MSTIYLTCLQIHTATLNTTAIPHLYILLWVLMYIANLLDFFASFSISVLNMFLHFITWSILNNLNFIFSDRTLNHAP
ncbi:hypothetical protein ACJX0J_028447, partial [Zea mays]